MARPHHPYPPPLRIDMFKPAYWGSWAGIALLWLIGRLPGSLRWRLGRVFGRLMLLRSDKRREIVELNLAWCFPRLSQAERTALRDEFAQWLGRSYLEFGFLWWASPGRFEQRIRFEGLESLQGALAAGQRVILFTQHTLAMDIGGVALSTRVPLTTFANAMRNPLLEWFMASRRARFGCTIHARNEGIRGVIGELKGGRVLFFPCDEDQGARQAETLFAPFFGIEKATLTSPLRLARLCRAQLMPCTTWFDEARGEYVVKLYPPLPLSGETEGDTLLLNRAFEQAINEAPAQYLWSQRLFTSRPDGSPPPYTMKGKPGSGPGPRPGA
ncbi:MAG: lysophospholipid acyltransferase family protein [Chromatiales bacterium]|nr:lysophospholipid acyltransferase family protein [Chromatiales bacterium]